MDPFAFPPVAAVLQAASTALTWLTEMLSPIAGASAAALAVVLVTLLVRAALIPAGVSQARAEQIRARLAPKLRAIRARHAKDPERLQRETMRIYAEAGASPFAGCLPMLAQMPVVAIIYGVFLHAEIAGGANALLTHELWGVSLGASAAGALAGATVDAASAALFGTIAVVLLAVGETTRRLFRIPAADEGPDLRWLGVLQFATAAIAMFVPLAAALYLVVTTVWTLAQRLVLRRLYPLDG